MVERACYRCGASIEDGAPFCPSCGAAQIRVTTEQPVPQSPPNNPVPAISSGPVATSAPVGIAMTTRRRSALPIALPLALVAGAICILGLALGWLVVMGMVVFATFRYQQRIGEISAGIGARVGALTGFLAYVFFVIARWIGAALSVLPFPSRLEREVLLTGINQALDRTADPQARQMFQKFTTGEGLVLFFVFLLIFWFIFLLVSATATGAVTGALIKKKPQQPQ